MQRQAVESGLIFSVGYDPVTNVLEIEFHRSKKQQVNPVYQYTPISQERFATFWSAGKSATNPEGSLGKYFLDHIRHDKTLTVTQVLGRNHDTHSPND